MTSVPTGAKGRATTATAISSQSSASRHDGSSGASPHGATTRLLHGMLALAVMIQLGASLGMMPPRTAQPGNSLFDLHEAVGLASFAVVLLFWAWTLVRRRGTALGALLPWLARRRLTALWRDVLRHGRALRQGRLPHRQGGVEDEAAMASAVHGLGLLVIAVMAASGTVFYVLIASAPALARSAIELHETLGALVWVYLIGHASMGGLAHLMTDFDLRRMWSLTGRAAKD